MKPEDPPAEQIAADALRHVEASRRAAADALARPVPVWLRVPVLAHYPPAEQALLLRDAQLQVQRRPAYLVAMALWLLLCGGGGLMFQEVRAAVALPVGAFVLRTWFLRKTLRALAGS